MTREHGTRSRYVTDRCRCEDCRAANAAYYHEAKKRVAPATVGAARARRHLIDLRRQGIGNKAVAATAGMSTTTVQEVVSGDVTSIRPETEQKILGVSAANVVDNGYVDAGPTWRIIEKLLAAGWTKTAINQGIGNKGRALQIRKTRIKAKTARAVAELWEREQAKVGQPGAVAPSSRAAYDLPVFWEGDTSWMKRGACRGSDAPTWLFFAGRGDIRTTEAAKAVCATCGVTEQCLDYALRNRAAGVWGGTSGAERRGMKPSLASCRDCGTRIDPQRINQVRCESCYQQYRLEQKYRWHHEVGKFRDVAS